MAKKIVTKNTWSEEFDKDYAYMESASSSKGELIKAFIKKTRADAIEACAKVAEETYKNNDGGYVDNIVGRHIAQAIRNIK